MRACVALEPEQQPTAPPARVAAPAGAGARAPAGVAHSRRAGVPRPALLSVEPDTAACVLRSLAAGAPVTVDTAATVMAGLNCGTVSAAAWPVLRAGCDAAVAVTDAATLQAVADLADLGVSSGPSGAATLAGVRAALSTLERRAGLGLDGTSTVVLLSTEGRRDDR
jgi:diaminopropionate ammonia-lyase